ncbi:cupin domain-containing protein [Kribbella shirazensis]|uniref:Quercetin dioxygenase-like cupin family protein n=1 Tax=Kribbella shirazensis TaxID=1105143 RepID=A0A7X5VJ40_9ACTN|nr:cupin domain-containing protein [Kribbella shirazensis]NIK62158.1 quercetin dioxygenase-like cupin family protein [Kribbella shirazensis]
MHDSAEASVQPTVEMLASVANPPVPADLEVRTVLITLPPGSAGSPPHRHPGPAFGYVLSGEVIIELEGEPERVVKAGEAFWEPGGDLIHYSGANNLPDAETSYVVTLLGTAGQPVLTPVGAEELEERRDRRASKPR